MPSKIRKSKGAYKSKSFSKGASRRLSKKVLYRKRKSKKYLKRGGNRTKVRRFDFPREKKFIGGLKSCDKSFKTKNGFISKWHETMAKKIYNLSSNTKFNYDIKETSPTTCEATQTFVIPNE